MCFCCVFGGCGDFGWSSGFWAASDLTNCNLSTFSTRRLWKTAGFSPWFSTLSTKFSTCGGKRWIIQAVFHTDYSFQFQAVFHWVEWKFSAICHRALAFCAPSAYPGYLHEFLPWLSLFMQIFPPCASGFRMVGLTESLTEYLTGLTNHNQCRGIYAVGFVPHLGYLALAACT